MLLSEAFLYASFMSYSVGKFLNSSSYVTVGDLARIMSHIPGGNYLPEESLSNAGPLRPKRFYQGVSHQT